MVLSSRDLTHLPQFDLHLLGLPSWPFSPHTSESVADIPTVSALLCRTTTAPQGDLIAEKCQEEARFSSFLHLFYYYFEKGFLALTVLELTL